MSGWSGSVLDREKKCDHCKRKTAVVLFDKSYLCARCYRAADAQLEREGKVKCQSK